MEMSQSMTDMDPRLRGERRSDLQKLQELLAERQDGADAVETLEKAKIMGAVDKCEIVSKKEAMVQEAIRSADTDGTGKKINVSVVLQRLSQDLLKEMDDEHLATAREALLDKHRDLVEKTRCVSLAAAPDFIEAHKLRGMLENSPFDLSEDVISSMMRLLDVKDEFVDSVRISEFMRLFCPVLDQTVFTAINAKIIEKYSGLKPAFNALQTNGNVDRAKLAEFLEALPLDPKLQHNEVQDLIKLADADGSGKIELPEFQNIFGTGEMCARTRQQNYKKLQDKNALPPSVRTDSIKSPSKKLASSTLSAEERVKEVILGSRAEELREAFRTVDKEGKGSLDMYALQGAFNKLGLELSEGDMVALVSKLQLSVKAPVDYTSLLTQIRERLSKASSLEEMQAEVVTALHDLLERKGEDKFWLVKAFQILDTETHGGKSRNKFSTAELAKVVGSLRMAASKSLIAQLKELADSERKDGSVNYADFVRMLGESANRLRSAKEGPAAITRRQSSGFIKEASLSGLSVSSIEQLELDDLSEEMEEEIREVIKGKFDTLTNAFRKFDKDGNGNISREEMLDGLKLLQLPISDKQYGKIISRADADGGGSIDFNEFKNAFEISARAVAKREEDKQKKVDEMLRKQRISEAAAASLEPEEEIEAVDPKAESFLWMTLQNRYSSIPLAFAFLKGRTGGKHADVLNEKELCNGLLRLHLMEQLFVATDDAIVASLLRASDKVSMVQKKDILVACKGVTVEAARLVLKNAGIDERGIRTVDEPSGKDGKSVEGVDPNPFEGTQGKALFRKYNVSKTGWLTQGEFIHALSVWTKAHPRAMKQKDEQQGCTAKSAPAIPPQSPTKGTRAGLQVRSPARASGERPHSAGGREHKIWPAMTRDPTASKDSHEAAERVRREEMELLRSKLKSIRQQEDRLLARNREADRREAELQAQKEVLEEREALLLGKEKFVQDGQAEVKKQQQEVDKLNRQLKQKLKEVEDRAAWLAEQKQVLQARQDQLQTLSKAIENSSESSTCAGAQENEGAVRSSKEHMAQKYREALEQKRRAMNVNRPYLGASRVGALAAGAAQAGLNAGLSLSEVSEGLKKEREGIAEQMERVEAMMKGLGLAAATNVP